MKSLKNFKHITDLINFEAVNEKITEEIKKYYFVKDALGRANFLHLFEYYDEFNKEVSSLCGEYWEIEEKYEEESLFTETELKLSIVGNPNWNHCRKCIKKFNKRRID